MEKSGTASKKPRKGSDDCIRPGRSIEYEELRAKAIRNPKLKQQIQRWPKDSDQFLVFGCKKHSLLFGLDGKEGIRGAAKHLRACSPGPDGNKKGGNTVRKCGYIVLGCDQDKMDRHNRGGRSERARSERSPSRGPRPDTIEMRAVGELCRVYYEPHGTYYAALVLPISNFSPVGMTGTLSIHTALADETPDCYRTLNNEIVGWADGYEDGGHLVQEREYPVLYLEDDIEIPLDGDLENPKFEGYAWVPAGDLETFSFTDPDAHTVNGFKTVRAYLERMGNLHNTGTFFNTKHRNHANRPLPSPRSK